MRTRMVSGTTVLAGALLVTALSSCRPQADLVVYRKSTFEFIFPETRPGPGEVCQALEVQVTPGEYEPASFAVYANREVRDATVTVSDLKGPGEATIASGNVDLRVVQVWEQKGIRGKDGVRIRVCEGLLKDDSLNLLDPAYTEMNLPSIPPDGPVRTDLERGASKQFFLTIHAPEAAAPGDYSGELKVGNGGESVALALRLKVLPFKLAEPGKIIGMYYNDNIGAEAPESVYEARLAYMRSMGVTALRTIAQPDTIQMELKDIREAGFTGPIIPWDQQAFFGPQGLRNMRFYVSALKGTGFDPYIYGEDEPNDPNAAPRARHSFQGQLIAFKRIVSCGAKCSTAVTVNTDVLLSQSQERPLDFPLYNPSENTGYKEYVAQIDANPAAKRHDLEGYYFGSWSENPRRNRLLAGFYLYNSHMDAAFGWTFYSYHIRGEPQIFNDFDLAPNAKRWMTVFPTREGCAPTMQSEAFREGVDDLRYLNTFLKLADQKEKEIGPGVVQPLCRQVLAEVARYKDMGENKPEDTCASQYTCQQFDDSRAVIIRALLSLLAMRPGG